MRRADAGLGRWTACRTPNPGARPQLFSLACRLPVYPPGVTAGAVVNGRTPSFGYTSLGK